MAAIVRVANSEVCIRIHSAAAPAFINGLSTNIVTPLHQPTSTLFLNAQGRFLAHALVVNQQQHSDLIVEKSCASQLVEHLASFDIRRKLRIDSSPPVTCASLVATAPAALEQFRRNIQNKSTCFWDPRSRALGLRVLLPAGDDALLSSLPHSVDSLCWHRVCAGVAGPMTGEIKRERTTPIEAGMDKFNSISFNKGCYLGQEPTARAHFTGTLRKHLFPCFLRPLEQQTQTIQQQELPIIEPAWPPLAAPFVDPSCALPSDCPSELPVYTFPVSSSSVSVGSFFPPQAGLAEHGVPSPVCYNIGFAQLRLTSVQSGSPALVIRSPSGSLYRLFPYLTTETAGLQENIKQAEQVK